LAFKKSTIAEEGFQVFRVAAGHHKKILARRVAPEKTAPRLRSRLDLLTQGLWQDGW
jgi:hypothetical protein